MNELVQTILENVVDNPGDLSITTLQGDKTTIYEVHSHADDAGKIIGKNGRCITAIRDLLTVLASRQERRVVIELANAKSNS